MFPLFVDVSLPDVRDAEYQGLRIVMGAMGKRWKDKMLPRHFQRSAHQKYNYQARARYYSIRKIRSAAKGFVKDGGLVDLVYTGLLREYMLNTGVVRATRKGCTITMAGPKYISMNLRRAGQPNKAAEITATTDQERNELAYDARQELAEYVESRPPKQMQGN